MRAEMRNLLEKKQPKTPGNPGFSVLEMKKK
jgi:hypothetical protein